MSSIAPPISTTEALVELRAVSAELYDLSKIGELLGWDQETMMPSKGVSWRASQIATLSGIHHEKLTAHRVGELVKRLKDDAADTRRQLRDVDRGLIREMTRGYERSVKLPLRLVKELAQATSESVAVWQKARAESNWSGFRASLSNVIGLKRQVAEHVGYTFEPYDAMLDEYEPGATGRQLQPMFDTLRAETVTLLGKINRLGKSTDRSILERDFPVDLQWKFGETVLGWMGFDFEAGRQDKSTHPFCSSFAPTDVRITTRLNANDLGQALFGSMHEGGHALYEQGIGEAVFRSAIGGGVSLGVHESQSRMWENFVGRSRSFWEYALPHLKKVFPDQLGDIDVETFWRAINQVRPTFIRVESDEVTYNLHIALRFDLERRLFAGTLSVDDLPAAWNASMNDMLGITPETDRIGVLQDIHWGFGLVGYFPTYTLGNLYGAQIWSAIGRDVPDRDSRIAAGDLRPILDWTRERIHQHGGTYLPGDLIERATGEAPNATYLGKYLNEKFAAVYGFSAE